MQQIALILRATHNRELVERWTFKINTRASVHDGCSDKCDVSRTQQTVIRMKIGDVLRQIMASISVLPRLYENTFFSFSMISINGIEKHQMPRNLRYHIRAIETIRNSLQIRFRSFGTGWHRVKTSVEYKSSSRK